MNDLQQVELKSFVRKSVRNIFHTMLSMKLEDEELPSQERITAGQHIVGTVGFAGSVMGNLNLIVSREFARAMTAGMLNIPMEEVEGQEDVSDVIGEVCNMVAGDLKSRLCDAGLACSLSIPIITIGEDFKVQAKGWDRHEMLCFKNSHHPALFEIYIKIPD